MSPNKNFPRFILKLRIFFLFLIGFTTTSSDCFSNEFYISGGVTARQEYDSNISRTNQNTISEWTTKLSPVITLSSKGKNSESSFEYKPYFVFNQRTNDERVDHNLFLKSNVSSKRLSFSVQDTYAEKEEPISDEEAGIILSDKRGKSLYRTNNAMGGLTYIFAKNSTLTLGYSHYILDNEDPDVEDFKRNNPYLSFIYQFSPQWQTQITYSNTYGDFEESENSETNDAGIRISYNFTQNNNFFVHYSFSQTDYDGLQTGYKIHTSSLGWGNKVHSDVYYLLEVGGSQLEYESGNDQQTTFSNMKLSKSFRRSSIDLSGQIGFVDLSFNGTDEDDLSNYWSVNLKCSYEVLKNLGSNFYGKYTEDKFINRTPAEKEKKIEAGASLALSFLKWYSITLNYTYNRLTADIPINEYEDNIFYIDFKSFKEFLKW